MSGFCVAESSALSEQSESNGLPALSLSKGYTFSNMYWVYRVRPSIFRVEATSLSKYKASSLSIFQEMFRPEKLQNLPTFLYIPCFELPPCALGGLAEVRRMAISP